MSEILRTLFVDYLFHKVYMFRSHNAGQRIKCMHSTFLRGILRSLSFLMHFTLITAKFSNTKNTVWRVACSRFGLWTIEEISCVQFIWENLERIFILKKKTNKITLRTTTSKFSVVPLELSIEENLFMEPLFSILLNITSS